MHWILTVSDTFSLAQVIRRSQWFLHPPFRVREAQGQLYRVERLTSGHTVAIIISQVPAGLILHTGERLTSKETEEISHRTWRMLRLGENLRGFLEVAKHTPGLESAIRQGVRFLRGTMLFEDIVKAAILTQLPPAQHRSYISWVVETFGSPLPSNPTHHAFPTPHQLIQKEKLLITHNGGSLGEQIMQIAHTFQTDDDDLQTLIQAEPPLETLVAGLQENIPVSEETLSLVMLNLGRYDYIPTDKRARYRVSRYWHQGSDVDPETVKAAFAPWQPWGGLAYWLWDWSDVTSSPFASGEGELIHGESARESQNRLHTT